jgi:hypothetical protein
MTKKRNVQLADLKRTSDPVLYFRPGLLQKRIFFEFHNAGDGQP